VGAASTLAHRLAVAQTENASPSEKRELMRQFDRVAPRVERQLAVIISHVSAKPAIG
jgi:hypothetical protein